MKICSNCKHWKQTSDYLYANNYGRCVVIAETICPVDNDGDVPGFNFMETPQSFGCTNWESEDLEDVEM